jgi:hypothetical protein
MYTLDAIMVIYFRLISPLLILSIVSIIYFVSRNMSRCFSSRAALAIYSYTIDIMCVFVGICITIHKKRI